KVNTSPARKPGSVWRMLMKVRISKPVLVSRTKASATSAETRALVQDRREQLDWRLDSFRSRVRSILRTENTGAKPKRRLTPRATANVKTSTRISRGTRSKWAKEGGRAARMA